MTVGQQACDLRATRDPEKKTNIESVFLTRFGAEELKAGATRGVWTLHQKTNAVVP